MNGDSAGREVSRLLQTFSFHVSSYSIASGSGSPGWLFLMAWRSGSPWLPIGQVWGHWKADHLLEKHWRHLLSFDLTKTARIKGGPCETCLGRRDTQPNPEPVAAEPTALAVREPLTPAVRQVPSVPSSTWGWVSNDLYIFILTHIVSYRIIYKHYTAYMHDILIIT